VATFSRRIGLDPVQVRGSDLLESAAEAGGGGRSKSAAKAATRQLSLKRRRSRIVLDAIPRSPAPRYRFL